MKDQAITLDVQHSNIPDLDNKILNEWFKSDDDDKFDQFEHECLYLFNQEAEADKLEKALNKQDE